MGRRGRRGDDFDCFSKSEVDLSSIGDRYVLEEEDTWFVSIYRKEDGSAQLGAL